MVNRVAHHRAGARGFTYIGLLLGIAVMAAGLAAASHVWHTILQRAHEAELRFVGAQFKHAIERYYQSSPGGVPRYPQTLEDLLLDTRHPVVVRHLRRIYTDPFTNSTQWGLVKHEERIVGVFSLSPRTPMSHRTAGAAKSVRTYSDWRFIAEQQPAAVAPGTVRE